MCRAVAAALVRRFGVLFSVLQRHNASRANAEEHSGVSLRALGKRVVLPDSALRFSMSLVWYFLFLFYFLSVCFYYCCFTRSDLTSSFTSQYGTLSIPNLTAIFVNDTFLGYLLPFLGINTTSYNVTALDGNTVSSLPSFVFHFLTVFHSYFSVVTLFYIFLYI
jgi:hypothetical protein